MTTTAELRSQPYGLDPEGILERRPELTWLTISGFGADSDRAGYNALVSGRDATRGGSSARLGADGAEALGSAAASPLTGLAPSVPPGRVRRRPPLLDEHGDAIRRLGWGAFAAVGV